MSLSVLSGERLGEVLSAPYAGPASRRSPVHLLSSGTFPMARHVKQKERAHVIGWAPELIVHPALATPMANECG